MKAQASNLIPVLATLAISAPASIAAVRDSASYSIPLEALDSGGREVSSTTYTSLGSLGGIAGTAAVASTQAVFGMIGQIDTEAPVLTLPSPIVVAADGTDGMPVEFSITAVDDLDPAPVVIATPASGTVFPAGDTTVEVSATDHQGNRSTGSFPVKVLSPANDTDHDGLNDAAEFQLSPLGYDWQIPQASLVNTLFSNLGSASANLNAAGYYDPSQLQALHPSTPLIGRDPATGRFKLTMDWKKSTDLSAFLDFPAPAGSSVSISPQGDIEFEFPSSDNAAFFRIEME
jgi:hypothetical protein